MKTSELPGVITCISIHVDDVSPENEHNLLDPLPETVTLTDISLTPEKIRDAIIDAECKAETGGDSKRYQIVISFKLNTGASMSLSFLREARMCISTTGDEI